MKKDVQPLSPLLRALKNWRGGVMGCEPLQRALERESRRISGTDDKATMVKIFGLAYRCFPADSFHGLIPDEVWGQLRREEAKFGPMFINLAEICNYCRVRLGQSKEQVAVMVSQIEQLESLGKES